MSEWYKRITPEEQQEWYLFNRFRGFPPYPIQLKYKHEVEDSDLLENRKDGREADFRQLLY
jgi:hypothetical protein